MAGEAEPLATLEPFTVMIALEASATGVTVMLATLLGTVAV